VYVVCIQLPCRNTDLGKVTNQEDLLHEEPYSEQAKTLNGKPSTRTLQHHATQAGARRFKKRVYHQNLKEKQANSCGIRQKTQESNPDGFLVMDMFTDEVHLQSIKLQNEAEYEL
jgi:hypothetical protein